MSEPYVVTISHQLGCGGALVGEKLAQALGVPFVDREILRAVSQRLHIAEADIKSREGRLSSFWQAFSRAEMLADPIISVSADCLLSDKELFDMESDVIARIARNSSAVILGRGGRYILRDHPRLLRVFVH
ncbi:MAG: cytidylate kinase-like family protein, partial [Clostridia bacterium]|nr:cytidylate kinase-like family protein [Clostridia bacterium]